MRQKLLIGAALGLVSAVVFASATTGPFVARFILVFITPLPLALAGLGWGPISAVAAGLAGTVVVGLWAGGTVALAFAASQVVPIVILTYLALLARPVAAEGAGPPALEWYPPGRLVIWAAFMAAVLAVISLQVMGGDPEALVKQLSDMFKAAIKDGMTSMPEAPQISDADIQALSEVSAAILPGASAVSWLTTLLLNIWLAGRITLASGQLVRPWPDLASISYPAGSALILGTSLIAASTLSGFAGQAAVAFVGAFAVPFFLLGLAVVHFTTRGRSWRSFALWALYVSLLFVQLSGVWIGLILVLVGLAEPVFKLRMRYAPPHPTANSST